MGCAYNAGFSLDFSFHGSENADWYKMLLENSITMVINQDISLLFNDFCIKVYQKRFY